MMQRRSTLPLLLLVLCATPTGAQDAHEAHRHAELGTVEFTNSGAAAAQPSFLRGMALLHSFEYTEAAAAFREAQRVDRGFAAAYWGEALTYSHVVWGEEDLAGARAALTRLAATPGARLARARTAGERGFGAAVEAMYAEGTQAERVSAFAGAARRWAAERPGEVEAHAFAALGSLWQMYLEEPNAARLGEAAAGHAQRVVDANPRHPGGAHYLIHAYDSPATARQGLAAARAYSSIAPDAEHALHMPSHIFLPLGMWEDMVDSNQRSWAASRSGRLASGNNWHGLNWLQYAYLQQGRWDAARALIDSARVLAADARRAPAADRIDAAYAMEQLAYRYGLETGRWDAFPVDSIAVDWTDPRLNPRTRAMSTTSAFQRASAALLSRGDTAPAARAVRAFRAKGVARLAAPLEAMLMEARGDSAGALAALQALQADAAVAMNRSMTPPTAPVLYELLGNALLARGRPAEAIPVFERSLRVRPNRAASLLGLARAKLAAGDSPGAREVYLRLAEQLAGGDRDLPYLPEIRAGIRPIE